MLIKLSFEGEYSEIAGVLNKLKPVKIQLDVTATSSPQLELLQSVSPPSHAVCSRKTTREQNKAESLLLEESMYEQVNKLIFKKSSIAKIGLIIRCLAKYRKFTLDMLPKTMLPREDTAWKNFLRQNTWYSNKLSCIMEMKRTTNGKYDYHYIINNELLTNLEGV